MSHDSDATGDYDRITLTALPHRVMESDVYDGYYIPAASKIIANVW